jgi:hypothetical protein
MGATPLPDAPRPILARQVLSAPALRESARGNSVRSARAQCGRLGRTTRTHCFLGPAGGLREAFSSYRPGSTSLAGGPPPGCLALPISSGYGGRQAETSSPDDG